MPLAYQPHSWTLVSASELIQSDTVVGTDHDPSITMRGQITPMSASASYEKWGLELSRPHLALTGLEHQDDVKVGDRFEMSGRKFTVKAKKIWNGLPGADCLEIALEEITDGPN